MDQGRLERWLLTLTCYQMAAREQLDRAGNLDDAEGLAARAKALNDELWRLGVPAPPTSVPPTTGEAITSSAYPQGRRVAPTSAPPRISRAQALESAQEWPCQGCGEPIPRTWTTHTYKKDQSPCGWKEAAP